MAKIADVVKLKSGYANFVELNRHGRIQNILATHEYEKTDWFFNMVLYVFMVKSAFEAAQKDAETEL